MPDLMDPATGITVDLETFRQQYFAPLIKILEKSADNFDEWLLRGYENMSADNWVVCPNCQTLANEARDKSLADVRALYGKIPPDEFVTKVHEIRNKVVRPQETFREDYSQGVDLEGLYRVTYSGSCKECGSQHNYEFSQQIAGPPKGYKRVERQP